MITAEIVTGYTHAFHTPHRCGYNQGYRGSNVKGESPGQTAAIE